MQDKFWNDKKVVSDFKNRPCSEYITNEIDRAINSYDIKNVIDIGCGGGRYSRYIKSKGKEVVAVDKNIEMVNIVGLDGIESVQADMSNIPYSDGSFDMVLSIGVIHNATTEKEFEDSIREIARLLKAGKPSIVSVFTNKLISSDLVYESGNCYNLLNDRPPMVLYSKDDIIQMFRKYGLNCEDVIDEHITDVGTGERNVVSFSFSKEM